MELYSRNLLRTVLDLKLTPASSHLENSCFEDIISLLRLIWIRFLSTRGVVNRLLSHFDRSLMFTERFMASFLRILLTLCGETCTLEAISYTFRLVCCSRPWISHLFRGLSFSFFPQELISLKNCIGKLKLYQNFQQNTYKITKSQLYLTVITNHGAHSL